MASAVVVATAGLASGSPRQPLAEQQSAFADEAPAGVTQRELTLAPLRVEHLRDGLLRTTFAHGVTHVGGAVSALRVTERRTLQTTSGLAVEPVLADQGYPTPAAYRTAGRGVTADLAALLGRDRTSAAASPGQVVQSGCVKIDVESHYYAYGCYHRKLAQNLPTGEILGETGSVTCHSRFYDMVQCGAQLRHAWVDRYAYIFEWAPSSDQDAPSCATKTWSLAWAGVGYSQSVQHCPTEYRMGITGESSGATFRNSWHGKVRRGASRSAAVVDTYRWQAPAQYRGSFRYVILVDTSPGTTRSCSSTCTSRPE